MLSEVVFGLLGNVFEMAYPRLTIAYPSPSHPTCVQDQANSYEGGLWLVLDHDSVSVYYFDSFFLLESVK